METFVQNVLDIDENKNARADL